MNTWQTYWERQTKPLHRLDTEPFYRRHAAEFRMLLEGVEPRSVLEIGCGTGSLYELLGFDRTKYTGVDFSQSMLNVFAAAYPGVKLVCADGVRYREDRQYDVIYSNALVQYLNQDMVEKHFANIRTMMHGQSLFVCGSVPWKAHRLRFLAGEFSPPYRRNILRLVRSWVGIKLRGVDPIGYWYDLCWFRDLALQYGMEVEFFASACYLYRFHAVLRCAK